MRASPPPQHINRTDLQDPDWLGGPGNSTWKTKDREKIREGRGELSSLFMVEILLSENCVYVVMGNYGGHHKPCSAHTLVNARTHRRMHTHIFLRLKKSP